MKIGQKVKVIETGQIGRINSIRKGRVKTIVDDQGKIINVFDKTITVLTLIKSILELIINPLKSIFKW